MTGEQVAAEPLPWQELEGAAVLIAGAGLLGGALIAALRCRNRDYGQHIDIIALSRSAPENGRSDGIQWLRQPVQQPIPPDIRADFIIHAAGDNAPGEFAKNPFGVIEANVMGMANLLRVMRSTAPYGNVQHGTTPYGNVQHGTTPYGTAQHSTARGVFVSSGEVYGRVAGDEPIREDTQGALDVLNPRSCYPQSKRMAENMCVCACAQLGVRMMIARPCHLFGGGMKRGDQKVVAQFVRGAMNGKVVINGDGLQRRSWCHEIDAASGVLWVLLKGTEAQAYNIAHPDNTATIRELAQLALRAAGRDDAPIVLGQPEPARIDHAVLDSAHLRALGWKPRVTLADGLREQIQRWGRDGAL